MKRCGFHAAIACALLSPVAAVAQEASDKPDRVARSAPETGEALTPKEELREKTDTLILPIPLSTPSTGTGLAVAYVRLYDPGDGQEPHITGIAAALTSNGTKGVGAYIGRSLWDGRFRFRALAFYGKLKSDYFGIGADAGAAGTSVELDNEQLQLQAQGAMQVIPHGYLGVRYRLNIYDTSQEPPPPGRPDLAIPANQLESTISTVGAVLIYDTRDRSLNARTGIEILGNWQFGIGALGSDFDYNKLQLSASTYIPLGTDTVLAGRAMVCSASGEVPYYELCAYGKGADLRGYEAGRYRDKAMWAAQVELRQHLFWRIGGVAFAGIGGIAPGAGEIFDGTEILPAGGIGVRYEAARKNKVNLRLDVGVGRHGPGVYLGIAEAF